MAKAKKTPDPKAAFSANEIAAMDRSGERGHRTPRKVLAAFYPKPIEAAGIRLRPLSLASFMLLEAIESPLLEEGAEISIRDLSAAVYVLAHDETATGALVAESRARFDAAVLAFAAGVPPQSLRELGAAVGQAVAAAMSTVLPTGEKKTTAATPT